MMHHFVCLQALCVIICFSSPDPVCERYALLVCSFFQTLCFTISVWLRTLCIIMFFPPTGVLLHFFVRALSFLMFFLPTDVMLRNYFPPPDVMLHYCLFACGRYAWWYCCRPRTLYSFLFSHPDVMLHYRLSASGGVPSFCCSASGRYASLFSFRLRTSCFTILCVASGRYTSLLSFRLWTLCFIISFCLRTLCFMTFVPSPDVLLHCFLPAYRSHASLPPEAMLHSERPGVLFAYGCLS